MKLSLIEWIAIGAAIAFIISIPACMHEVKEIDQSFAKGEEFTPELVQELRDNAYHAGYLQGALDALEGNLVTKRKDILNRRDS